MRSILLALLRCAACGPTTPTGGRAWASQVGARPYRAVRGTG